MGIFDNNTHRILRIRINQSLTVIDSHVYLGLLEQRDWISGSLALTMPHFGLAHCAYTLISNTYAFPPCSVSLDLSATGKTANQLDFSLIQYRFRRVSTPLRTHIEKSFDININTIIMPAHIYHADNSTYCMMCPSIMTKSIGLIMELRFTYWL